MNYFMTEPERKQKHTTCCFEFQKGAWQEKCWLEDSICLDADIFDENHLYELFIKAVPQFDSYGPTQVSEAEWQTLLQLSHSCGGIQEEIIQELAQWVRDCFQSESVFTVCGI